MGAGFEDTIQLMRKKEKEYKEKKRRKRKVQKACRAEFDYTGWSTFNTWRREIRAIKHGQFEKLDAGYRIREIRHWQLPPLSGRGEASERGEGKKDCWRDCDFPSECLNARVKEREWTLQRQKMLALEEEWVRERARLQQLIEAGPETPDSVMEGNADVDADDEEEVDTVEFYDAEECSPPLAQDADLIVANHKEEDEAMGIGDDNLGPLGTDCDGLGEESKQALYTNCRRKSLDSVAEGEVPPNSPLKECSFGFEDVELGCNIWVSERERKWNEDVQMAEVEEKGVYF